MLREPERTGAAESPFTPRSDGSIAAAKGALAASEDRFRLIFEHSPDAIFVEDRDGVILDVNPAACALHGLEPEGLIGKSVYALVPEHEMERVRRDFPLWFSQEICRYDGISLTAGGKNRKVDILGSPICYDGRDAILLQVRDVTEQRERDEERRRELEDQLHSRRLESLGLLAGGIAHDFNNLLVSIQGNAELAMDDTPPTSRSRECLEDIGKASERASELCRELLAYSGRGRFRMATVDLAGLVEDMCGELSPLTDARLSVSVPGGACPVECDADQMGQALLNILRNAEESYPDGHGVIHVRTGIADFSAKDLAENVAEGFLSLPAGRYAYVSVADSGCGMNSEVLHRMFDPFFSSKRVGRGLGLPAVQGTVRGHGGGLQVRSRPGEGTEFTLCLRESPKSIKGAKASGLGPGTDELEGCVLLVDDEPDVLRAVSKMFERAGMRVLTAGGGNEAMTLLRDRQDGIDFMLLDMTMPGMSGGDVVEAARGAGIRVPIVLTSGYDRDEMASQVGDGRVQGFLQKPFRRQELIDLARRVMGGELEE